METMIATRFVKILANLLVERISGASMNDTSAINSATVNPILANEPTTATSHQESAGLRVPLVNRDTRKAPNVTPIGCPIMSPHKTPVSGQNIAKTF